jgi:peptidoglycan/LPS O-acetylase OafA/YrhL
VSAPTPVAATPSETTSRAAAERPNRLRALWNAITGALGAVLGLAPHVLHHIGFLAGTAVVAGTAGTVLFGAIGLLASAPFLLRLHRRFGSWRAPAIGLAVFAVMFSLSAFVLGPAISGGTDSPAPTAPGVTLDEHGH